jgi:hypothetical protein
LKIYSRSKTLNYLLLRAKIDPRNIRHISKKRSASSLNEEIQPKHERSDRGHRSLILGPRTRESATLAVSFGGEEERRSPCRSPSFTLFKDFQERGRLPRTLKNDVPSNICVVDMEFMTCHQPNEYMAQVPHP